MSETCNNNEVLIVPEHIANENVCVCVCAPLLPSTLQTTSSQASPLNSTLATLLVLDNAHCPLVHLNFFVTLVDLLVL